MHNSLLNNVFEFVYYQPLWIFILIYAVSIILLGKNGYKVTRENKIWWYANKILLVTTLIVVVWQTLLSRSVSDREVEFIPFVNIINSSRNEDILRSMLMNVFLFIPMGLTMPFALPIRYKQKQLITIVVASLLSCIIEFLQYLFSLGRCETDDVLCNTIGAAIGTMSYFMGKRKSDCFKRREN